MTLLSARATHVSSSRSGSREERQVSVVTAAIRASLVPFFDPSFYHVEGGIKAKRACSSEKVSNPQEEEQEAEC